MDEFPEIDVPDEVDETEGEAWVKEKDVTPDMSADDGVPDDPAPEDDPEGPHGQ